MARSTTKTDFRKDLGADPTIATNEKARALTSAAAEQQAQGHLKNIQGRIDLFNNMFQKSVEAGTGLLKAKQAKEILGEIDKLEGFGATAIENQKRLNELSSAVGQEAVGNQIVQAVKQHGEDVSGNLPGGFAGAARGQYEKQAEATINQVIKEVEDEKLRLAQGIQSQATTITNIAAITKRYSAMVPGLASEFRQVAANKTGLSNVDTLEVYDALTKESQATKAAAAQAEVFKAYQKQVQTYFGKPWDQITDAEKNQFAASTAMNNLAKQRETQLQNQELTLAQSDREALRLIDLQFAVSEANLNTRALQLLSTTEELSLPNFRKQQAAYSRALKEEKLRLDSYVDSLETGANEAGFTISKDRAKFLRERIAERVDIHSKWFEDQDNYDAYTALREQYSGDAEMLMNAMSIESPLIAFLGKTGVLPEVSKSFWMLYQGGAYDEGQKKAFINNYGQKMWNDFVALAENPDPTKARLMQRLVDPSDNISPRAVQDIAPDAARITVGEGLAAAQKLSNPAYQAKPGDAWHMLGAMKQLRGTSPVADPQTYGQLNDALKSGALKKGLDALSPGERQMAVERVVIPMYNHLTQGMGNTMDKVLDAVTDEPGRMLVWDGEKFVLEGSPNKRDYLLTGQGIQAQVNQLNRMVELHRNIGDQGGLEVIDVGELFSDFNKGYAEQVAKQAIAIEKELAKMKDVKEAPTDELSAAIEGNDIMKKRALQEEKERLNKKLEQIRLQNQSDPGERIKRDANRTATGTITPAPAAKGTKKDTSPSPKPENDSDAELVTLIRDVRNGKFDAQVIPDSEEARAMRLGMLRKYLPVLEEAEAKSPGAFLDILEVVRTQVRLLEASVPEVTGTPSADDSRLRSTGTITDFQGLNPREGPQIGPVQ